MDPRKWIPFLPLFRTHPCVYCGGPADSSDHTPPQCLLPKPLPTDVQMMTVPACSHCNGAFSQDEIRTAAVVCTVSFTDADQLAVAPGGWIHSAMQRDRALQEFVQSRIDADGTFRPDKLVLDIIGRVATKTAAGLLFYEFGRVIPLSAIEVIAIEHTKNIHPSALAEVHRRVDAGWAEVTASGRELERQVTALLGVGEPRHMPKWHDYVPEYFAFMFLHRSNEKLLTAMKFHDALTIITECPWPTRAGPRRKGRLRSNK